MNEDQLLTKSAIPHERLATPELSSYLSLLEKYSKPGPRYTSYPTAPNFHQDFAIKEWREELEYAASSNRPISLYVHIPFCDTLCYFCGCNMIATTRYQRVEPYINHIRKEMETVASIVGNNRVVEQLHWGGGTPTFLKPEDIRRVAGFLRESFGSDNSFSVDENGRENTQISCEIDPRELTLEHLQALRESGFNRVSFGVQDLEHKVQVAVNRVQPESMVREVYGWARDLGFSSINLDLMTGLPYQTLESFNKTLDVILELSPDRLAVFAYAHLPQMIKHQALIPDNALPDVSTRLELQVLVKKRLSAAGYINIGMDHYAKPTDEMVIAQQNKTLWRNFQGYTTHKDCDIFAFGVSSISQTKDVYCQNQKKINDYESHIKTDGLAAMRGVRLNINDQMRRDLISRLMCHLSLDISAFEQEWQINLQSEFNHALASLTPMQDDGLVLLSNKHIEVTTKGQPFIRNIVMVFDAYLATTPSPNTNDATQPLIQQKKRVHFSKTI